MWEENQWTRKRMPGSSCLVVIFGGIGGVVVLKALKVEHGERASGRKGFNESAKKHLGCLLHSACVDARAEDEKQRNALHGTFAAAADREMATMKRLFICLHVIVQEKRSLHSFETLVHALDECGTDVGHKEHSRKT